MSADFSTHKLKTNKLKVNKMNIAQYHQKQEKHQDRIAAFMWVIIGFTMLVVLPMISHYL